MDNILNNDRRPIIFLDRDGTIIKNIPYLSNPNNVKILPEVVNGLTPLGEEFQFVVVTNQSGIGRETLSVEDVRAVHKRITLKFKLFGLKIDQFIFCPHHPMHNCDCRKPKPLMLNRVLEVKNVAPENCYLIGDSKSDIEAAKSARVNSYLVHDEFFVDNSYNRSPHEGNFKLICQNILNKHYQL